MDSHQPPQGQPRTIVGFHLDEQSGMGPLIKDRRNGVQTFRDFLCHSDGDSIYPGFRSGLAANRK
jgi:hypothetical protein